MRRKIIMKGLKKIIKAIKKFFRGIFNFIDKVLLLRLRSLVCLLEKRLIKVQVSLRNG